MINRMTISIRAIITAIITPTTANTVLGAPSSSASLVSVGVAVGVLGVVCVTRVVVPPASVLEVVGAIVTMTLLPVSGSEGVVEATVTVTGVSIMPLLSVSGSESVVEAVMTGVCISLLPVSGSEGVVKAAMKRACIINWYIYKCNSSLYGSELYVVLYVLS